MFRLKSQSKVFIIGTILLISSIFTYTLFFMGAILEESGGDDESDGEGSPFTPLERIFPEDYLSNITDINEIEGYNISHSGDYEENLNALKRNDDDLYSFSGDYDNFLDQYKYNIEFLFDANLSEVHLDYYDFYLYLDIEASIISDILWFQVYDGVDELWEDVAKITILPIHIENEYFEDSLKFRIIGITNTLKEVSIDRINLLYTHLSDVSPPQGIEGEALYWMWEKKAYDVGCAAYHPEDLYYEDGFYYTSAMTCDGTDDASVYKYNSDFGIIWRLRFYWGFVDRAVAITTHGDYLYVIANNGKIHKYNQTKFSSYNYHKPGASVPAAYEGVVKNIGSSSWSTSFMFCPAYNGTDTFLVSKGSTVYLYNTTWDLINTVSISHSVQDVLYDNSSYFYFLSSKNIYTYYNNLTYTGYSFNLVATSPSSFAALHGIWNNGSVWNSGSGINLGKWFTLSDSGNIDQWEFRSVPYIQIGDIYTYPPSPISSIENFDIRLEISNPLLLLETEIELAVMIRNSTWRSQWFSMQHYQNRIWKTDLLDINDYENGEYDLWINATSIFAEHFYRTFKLSSMIINNSRPRINFINPYQNGQEVRILYGFNINISILEPESEPYGFPSLRIYETANKSNVVLNWTVMDRYNILNPNYFNYSIDPLDFQNGVYTIEVRCDDERGYGYNQTDILIENNPPNITIFQPLGSLFTQTPMSIVVNISNEEPINTAEWDIVDSLGSYEWKNLTYNPVSEMWEASVDLLEYAYGDYFLVLNATDDKYNSSLKIKAFQFRPFLTYYIPTEEISYTSSEITISHNSKDTDDIVAFFSLKHHSVAMERDFEVYISEDYEDAHNYYIIRGYNTFFPEGYLVEGNYTLWSLPSWQDTDLIRFELDKPKITNEPFKESDGNYEFTFTLSTKHGFTDLTIENTLPEYLPDPENYEYAVFYQFGGVWIEIKDEIEIDASGNIDFSFAWRSIDENSTIEFKFTATQLDIQETDWTPVIVGATLGVFGVGIAAFILVGLKKHEDWGKLKVALLAAGIGAAAGVAGYLIVLFF